MTLCSLPLAVFLQYAVEDAPPCPAGRLRKIDIVDGVVSLIVELNSSTNERVIGIKSKGFDSLMKRLTSSTRHLLFASHSRALWKLIEDDWTN